jgi:hypothetical protein
MIARNWLFGVATAFAASAAIAAQPAPADPPADTSEAARKIAACEGEKFEFSAGEPRPTKITLCSDKGATTADLVRMFESAAAKIEQLDTLSADRRAALISQLKGKIIEVRARTALITPLPANVLPREIGPKIEYAQLPPLPAPVPMAVATKPSASPAIALAAPRLTLECITPGEIGVGGPCIAFARDTLLTIRADETLPAGTSLRFLRRGNVRSELALARMGKGQSRRIKLPAAVCAGVTASRIEIQVVRSDGGASSLGQVADRLGPYDLRC